jgi:Reverse transcriptase (RNA-dependent DNA polymerase)
MEKKAPADWAKSHIVLIPKCAEPQSPKEYRPLSIDNMLYKLYSKLLSNRLQPYVSRIILVEQTTFIRGRTIADNILLMNEVVHSFKDP